MERPNNHLVEEKRQKLKELRGSTEGLHLVLKAFEDESWRVRKTALGILLEDYDPRQYLDRLIELLYLEDNAGARNTAIEALAALGEKAVSPLMDAFKTENRDVRKFIIDILGEVGGKEVVPLLLDAIRDEDDNVRASAVEYLGKFREASVVKALMELVKGDDLWIAYPAVDALGRIGDRDAISVLRESLSIRALTEPALRALGAFSDPETLPDIIPLIYDKRRSIQEEVLRTLERFYRNGVDGTLIGSRIREFLGDDACQTFLRFIEHEDRSVRESTAIILGLLADPRAATPLLDMTDDEQLRDVAVRALSDLCRSMPQAFPPLLEEAPPEKRAVVVQVMAENAISAFRDVFRRLLEDRDGHVVVQAVRGLGRICDEESVSILKGVLGHPYRDVQEELLASLVRCKKLLQAAEVVGWLSDENASVRKIAAILLGVLDYDNALPELGLAIRDPDSGVRTAAMRSLSHMLGASGIRYLRIGLTDESPEVRVAAVNGLGSLGTEDAITALLMITDDHDERVRAEVAQALSHYRDERAKEGLLRMLDERNGFVLTRVIEALKEFPDRDVQERIAGFLNTDDQEVRRTAILSLSYFKGTEEIIGSFLFSADWATRLSAVRALKRIGTEKAMEHLERVYEIEEDITVRRELEGALGV